MIRPAVADTVETLRRAVSSAGCSRTTSTRSCSSADRRGSRWSPSWCPLSWAGRSPPTCTRRMPPRSARRCGPMPTPNRTPRRRGSRCRRPGLPRPPPVSECRAGAAGIGAAAGWAPGRAGRGGGPASNACRWYGTRPSACRSAAIRDSSSRCAAAVPRTTATGPGRRSRSGPPFGAPKKRSGWSRPAVVLAVVVALLVVGGGAAAPSLFLGGRAGAETVTEPIGTAGANPFMPSVGTDTPNVTPPPNTAGSFPGNTPGLYGGTLNSLELRPRGDGGVPPGQPGEGGRVGRGARDRVADIPGYVAQLTPVILRSRHLCHQPRLRERQGDHVALGAAGRHRGAGGRFGTPRVKCYCGNPLTPAGTPSEPRFVGPTWPGFAGSNITVIQETTVVIETFTLVNPLTNEVFERPAGTTGAADRPTGATVPSTSHRPGRPNRRADSGATPAGAGQNLLRQPRAHPARRRGLRLLRRTPDHRDDHDDRAAERRGQRVDEGQRQGHPRRADLQRHHVRPELEPELHGELLRAGQRRATTASGTLRATPTAPRSATARRTVSRATARPSRTAGPAPCRST